MFLTSDYHTHTVFSHGKGKIIDNAMVAKEKGLKEIGISDHGFSHPIFGLSKRDLPKMKKLCKTATDETGVKVLLGIESNIIGTNGTVDLKEKYYDYFDIFSAGYHKFIMFKPDSAFNFGIPNVFYSYFFKNSVSNSLIKLNTRTMINVIQKNPIDYITHLNYCCPLDVKEVAKACADYGTYIELNAKKIHLAEKQIEDVLSTDVRFVINSDAHSPERVGEISLVEEQIHNRDFPFERIDNIEGRLPDFRFRKFKEKSL